MADEQVKKSRWDELLSKYTAEAKAMAEADGGVAKATGTDLEARIKALETKVAALEQEEQKDAAEEAKATGKEATAPALSTEAITKMVMELLVPAIDKVKSDAAAEVAKATNILAEIQKFAPPAATQNTRVDERKIEISKEFEDKFAAVDRWEKPGATA